MPKLHPIHYSPDNHYSGVCGLNILTDPQLMIGTEDPAGVTCSRCLTSPAMAGMTPVTREEYGALVSRARRVSLWDVLEPYDDMTARRLAEDERRFRVALALDALYRETPWWRLGTRHLIRQALASVSA